jgi:hypothetical protein
MALEVKGKVSLDGSGFDRTLKGMSTQVSGFSNKVKAQIGGAFIAAFGASAVKNFGKELLEQAENIDALAKKFNLTTTQVQQLQEEAKRTGVPFEELVKDATKLEETLKNVAGQPVLFSSENLDNLRAINEGMDEFSRALKEQILSGNLLNDALSNLTGGAFGRRESEDNTLTARQEEFLAKEAEEKRKLVALAKDQAAAEKIMLDVAALQEKARMKALSDEERAVELTKERQRNLNFLNDPKNSAKLTQTQLAEKEKRVAEIDLELAKEPEKKKELKPTERGQAISFGLNQLQSIGGFAGANPLVDISKKQLAKLEGIEKNTQAKPAQSEGFH